MFGGYAPLPLRLTQHPDGLSVGQHAAAARDVQSFRTVPLAVLRFTAGTADSLSGFTSRLGIGLQYRPTITTSGTGIGIASFPSSMTDALDQQVITNIVAADAQAGNALGGSAAAVDTVTIDSPSQVTVRRTDDADTPTSGPVILFVYARLPERLIGHYGGAQDKEHARHEKQPYAYWQYRYMQEARGTAINTRNDYTHAENMAVARALAMQMRAAETLSANALARTADADLPRYERDFGLGVRAHETAQERRQRAAAFEEGPRKNDPATIDQALRDLLGDLFVRTWWTDQSAALTSPPSPTLWPGVNPGPAAYDLGGGTWLSARAHVVVEVTSPRGMELRRYLELLNVDMFHLLSARLPVTMTFNWAQDVTNGGFMLDISQLDFAGLG